MRQCLPKDRRRKARAASAGGGAASTASRSQSKICVNALDKAGDGVCHVSLSRGTLIAGMRLLVSNAAVDLQAYRVINIDATAQMSDLCAAAARRLLKDSDYIATGDERVEFLMMNNGTHAEVDDLDELTAP